MPRNKISDIIEGRILQLLQQGYSQPRIVNVLKLNRIHISQSTVSNVKRKIGSQRNAESKIKISQENQRKQHLSLRKSSRKLMLKIHYLNALSLNLFVLANLLFRTLLKILDLFFEKNKKFKN